MSNKLNRRDFPRMGDLVRSPASRYTHEVDVQPQVKTISGTQTSLEDDCDDYVAGLDALDSARYLEINQRAYEAIQY